MSENALNSWTNETLYYRGDEYFSALIAELEQARFTIDFESYIFEQDPLGERVTAALSAAAARGVRVRLLVDGIGSPGFNSAWVNKLDREGIFTRIYHPLPWVFPLPASRLARFTKTKHWLERFFLLNRRDHRKLCLIDDKIAWLGSLNVDSRHLREFYGDQAWHDIGVRVEGPEINALLAAFNYAWRRASGLRFPTARRIRNLLMRPIRRLSHLNARGVRLNTSRRKRRIHYHALLNQIALCRSRVWVATAYFAPEFRLTRALRRAAAAGADVRVLIPHRSDVFFMPWVTEAFYSHLLLGGVRIFEYLPTFLHAKAMIIDDSILIGSSNLNHRSLLHDLEIDIILDSPEALSSLTHHFENDFERALEIRLPSWKRLPLLQRLAGRVFLYFKYWL